MINDGNISSSVEVVLSWNEIAKIFSDDEQF